MAYLKIDRAGFIFLMTLTNLAATLIDSLAIYYLPLGMATIITVFVTGLANALAIYFSTEAGNPPPPTTTTPPPAQIIPFNWARLRSRLHL